MEVVNSVTTISHSPQAAWEPAPLEKLPLYLLEEICDFVVDPGCDHISEAICDHFEAGCRSDRASLFAFSLVSKASCAAAARQRFARIHLVLHGTAKLHSDVEKWDRILQDDRARFVRFLKVTGSVSSEDTPPMHPRPSREHIIDKQRQSGVWLPLARLLSRLMGLKDLSYQGDSPIPPSVLSALHHHCPTSRLHMPKFSLPSLIYPPGDLRDIDADDLVLATSPCLYSLTANCSLYAWPGYGGLQVDSIVASYTREAVMHIVGGSAAGLKHVHMTGFSGHELSTPHSHSIISNRRAPWKGFFPTRSEMTDSGQHCIGHLQSLILSHHMISLQDWREYTAFDKLHSLEIRQYVNLSVLEQLADLGNNGEFPHLRSLVLSVGLLEHRSGPPLDLATCLALQSLRPLRDLCLTGRFAKSTYMAVLNYHGTTLRKLVLQPSRLFHTNRTNGVQKLKISKHLVRHLVQQCTSLEELNLVIPRTMGNDNEVAIYEHLAKLPHLKRLALTMDYSFNVGTKGETHKDIKDKPARSRSILASAAVDATLATNIFHIASSGNSLEYLKLHPRGLTDICPAVLRSNEEICILRWLGRKWDVEKDDKGHIVAREIDMEERMKASEYMGTSRESPKYIEAWRKLWPKTMEDYEDDWSSFPLGQPPG